MRQSILKISLLLLFLTGTLSACGAGGPGQNFNADQVASIELRADQDSLRPGENLLVEALVRDAQGNLLAQIPVLFEVDISEYAEIDPQGLLQARYPGLVQVTGSIGAVRSAPLPLTILPLEHLGQITRLTDNDLADDWGPNNFWRTTARGVVLWQRILANANVEVLLHDRRDAVDDDQLVATVPFPNNDVDFMALGTGAGMDSVLATYRVNLSTTFASEDGAPPVNLGDQNQEENSIDMGCFFFREGGGFNDIQRYTLAQGLVELADVGDLYGPIGSGCQAAWEKRGLAGSELVFFDGADQETVAGGLPMFPQYDFKNGILVFARGGDIFAVDTRQGPPYVEMPLTQDGMAVVEDFPKTDGVSVVFRRNDGGAQHVVQLDLAGGGEATLSTNNNPKAGTSLAIDQKQVIWTEGADLYFHPGTMDAADTVRVDPGLVPRDVNFQPHLHDGLVTWVGNDGDTEIFTLE